MHIRHIKELYSIIDMILHTIKRDDYIEISVKFSGIIIRYNKDNAEHAHVTDAVFKVFSEYNESGISIGSVATKSIIQWLSKVPQCNYMKTNSYLSFIYKLDEADITSICVNGDDKLKDFVNDDGNVCAANFMEYVIQNSKETAARVCLTCGEKTMCMIYADNVFSRVVKQDKVHTLYINSKDSMDRILRKYYVSGFALCTGYPSINTRIKMCEDYARLDESEFRVNVVNE